jgi:hypothetical protein
MTYLVNPGNVYSSDQGASAVLGEISRAQWDDWEERFAPKVEELAAIATDTGLPGELADQSMEAVGNSFDNANKSLAMKQAGLGLQLDATEQASQDRVMALSKASTQADQANSTRVATQDMQQSILAGDMGLQNLPSEMMQNL